MEKPRGRFILMMLPLFFLSQHTNAQVSCKDIYDGTFYYYPKNSENTYKEVRRGEFLHERNEKNNDTGLYKIKWMDDCTFQLKYVVSNSKNADEVEAIFRKYKIIYKITNVTKNYYTFQGFLDKTSNLPFITDTMWMAIKNPAPNFILCKAVEELINLKKAHFSDTSKYAVLYLYRPGKLTNSLGEYPVYLNDLLLCSMKNNSGYVFMIYREGNYKIGSTLYGSESSTAIDIKFGKSYYVKSTIPWGFHGIKNYKLEMNMVPAETGKSEFMEVEMNK